MARDKAGRPWEDVLGQEAGVADLRDAKALAHDLGFPRQGLREEVRPQQGGLCPRGSQLEVCAEFLEGQLSALIRRGAPSQLEDWEDFQGVNELPIKSLRKPALLQEMSAGEACDACPTFMKTHFLFGTDWSFTTQNTGAPLS